ncbi:hypothetical protein GDO81_015611 [Engystomops pustulosus]|uniref:Uncharacterized protein n=1 Tax=Engystomops pustulosus TaxID=76066 RepID=A0AAV7AN57_ENGPU|nr:hypothetical protein GDO81_015611 [Engystomops pustulosus]
MVWDEETDGGIATKDLIDKDVLEMLQGLKTRNNLVLQELTSLYETWRGPSGERSLHLERKASKPKVNVSTKGPEFTVPQPFQMMLREAEKRQNLKGNAWGDLKDEPNVDDEECLKKFRAQPVPAHVFLPLYNEIMEQNETRRQTGIQKRKKHLMSMQKPFHLTVQDRSQQVERPVSDPSDHKKVASKQRSIPKSVLDPTVSDRLREAEILRKINSHLRAKDLQESSSAPIPLSRNIRDPNSRTSLKTKEQHLGFLQQDLTFKPRINQYAPDFETLHRNFQKLSLRNQATQEPTETKPFNLRTTRLSSKRRSKKDDKQETLQETPPRKSLSHLSSLSPNTLPVYITDSTKRREVAIRSSLEDKDNQIIEKEKWLRKHHQKSMKIQNSLSRRAKALDPHKPLAASNKETVRQKQEADRRRMLEYKKELKEMMSRVNTRAFLFEQVAKGCVIKNMERRYTETLEHAGLNDDFVQQKGRTSSDLSEFHDSEDIDEEAQ